MTDAGREAREPELDPKLEEWLAQAREDDAAEAPPALDDLFEGVARDIEAAEKKPSFWLRTRATWMRRLIGGVTAALVVVLGGVLGMRDLGELPALYVGAALASLVVLLGLSLHQALRPLHRPPLPRGAQAAVVALTLLATFLLALLSPHAPEEAAASRGAMELVSPCLFYGLFIGLPVYLVLRLLDRRGGVAAPLLAACAAGLAGNLTLQLKCPNDDPQHLMLSHFAVALLFVAGLGLTHLLVRRLRR
ncbi:MAG TPA: NrsF family protein [Sandaracinaceae bacterium LLY-WYZ-13_1]|nr:NrsF family protein [Sandaracinaceae bacterium LLY-WYZ-13_1]